MSQSRLGPLLARLVALAAAPTTTLACGATADTTPAGNYGGSSVKNDAGPDGIVPAEVMTLKARCVDIISPDRYTALTLGAGIDGIAFYQRASTNDSPDAAGPPPIKLAPVGAPCSKAANAATCTTAIDAATLSLAGWSMDKEACSGGCVGELVHDVAAATSGDTVTGIGDADALVKAVAPIDTLDEAATILRVRGRFFDCDANNARPDGDGFVFSQTTRYCSGKVTQTLQKVARDGQVTTLETKVLVDMHNGCMEGRRPLGLVPTRVAWLESVTACFGEIAHMEAAAVMAFADLARDLRALGAPASLLERVERARKDEVRHARATARLARKHGAIVKAPNVDVTTSKPRSILDLAIENATEGCLRETFGALVAAFQGAHAAEACIRATFTRIAQEEAEHAELSWALDAWYATRLTVAERQGVERSKAQGLAELAVLATVEPAEEVVRIAGMPTAAQAARLLATLPMAVAAITEAA